MEEEKKICGRCSKPKETIIDLDGKDFLLNRRTAGDIENPKDFICMCGRPLEKLVDWEEYWNEKLKAVFNKTMAVNGKSFSAAANQDIDWSDVIIGEYSEGAADIEVRAMLELSNDLWERFMEDEQKFSETIKKGRVLSEAWWTKTGRVNLENKDFSSPLYRINMANRFDWREKQDTDVKSDGKAIQGLAVSFVKPGDDIDE